MTESALGANSIIEGYEVVEVDKTDEVDELNKSDYVGEVNVVDGDGKTGESDSK